MNYHMSLLTGKFDGRARLLVPVLVILSLTAACAFVTGCGSSSSDVTYPPEPKPEDNPWFNDVYGTAADNVHVVGNKGLIYRFDGASWATVNSGTSQLLTTVWGAGDGTLYACGHGGVILRNTGSGWTTMTSGTEKDLYGLGRYQGTIHAVGYEGAMRRLSGGSWGSVPSMAVIRDPQNDAATDTLDLRKDTASLLTVSHNFIGGAYNLPKRVYSGPREGRLGTDGMVIGLDETWDWLLRPLRGDQIAASEWVYCTTSDDVVLGNNYLGTSEGWLFQLEQDSENVDKLVWRKFTLRITDDRNTGIRDMWLDSTGDLYMVTDGGRIVYRAVDGTVRTLYNQVLSFTGIWGSSPADFYVVGYMAETIMHCSYEPATDTFSYEMVSLPFPE